MCTYTYIHVYIHDQILYMYMQIKQGKAIKLRHSLKADSDKKTLSCLGRDLNPCTCTHRSAYMYIHAHNYIEDQLHVYMLAKYRLFCTYRLHEGVKYVHRLRAKIRVIWGTNWGIAV